MFHESCSSPWLRIRYKFRYLLSYISVEPSGISSRGVSECVLRVRWQCQPLISTLCFLFCCRVPSLVQLLIVVTLTFFMCYSKTCPICRMAIDEKDSFCNRVRDVEVMTFSYSTYTYIGVHTNVTSTQQPFFILLDFCRTIMLPPKVLLKMLILHRI